MIAAGQDGAGDVHNTVSGGEQRGTVFMGRDIYIQSQQRPSPAGRPVSLPPRPPLLTGRESLLTDLHSRLAGGNMDWPRVVALTGLGGVGKTSIAAEYAHRHMPAGVIWQFQADTPITFADQFAQLARKLTDPGAVPSSEDPVATVHSALANSADPWLLVIDNAPDADSVRPFLPRAGPGVVLITSQSAIWRHAEGIEVPALSEPSAVDFLIERTKDTDAETAATLAREAGGLPLALEQMGGYTDATGIGLAGYLELYRRARPEMLSRGRPVGYPRTVATTWSVAFAGLEKDAPEAAGLLRVLACLAPDPVPLRILLQQFANILRWRIARRAMVVPVGAIPIRDAVTALRRYSLVTPAAGEAILVHRLVQAVTLDQMPAMLRRSYQKYAALLIQMAMPDDPKLPESWPEFGSLLPHAQAVMRADNPSLPRLAAYLGVSGSFVAAQELLQEIVQGPAHRGPEHRDTLTNRANLAEWTGKAGDAAGARDQLIELVPVEMRVFGPEHPETLASRGNLAQWTGMAGDPVRALDMYAELAPIFERVLGSDNPHTLTTHANQAYWTGEAGNPVRARGMYAEILSVRERLQGPEHPDTLSAGINLAEWTGRAGDPVRARDLHAELLPVVVHVLGLEHPDTLVTRASLAGWSGEAGDAARAGELFTELLPVFERVYGADHWRTLRARSNLAEWTGRAGEPVQARDMYAELTPIFERTLGPEHPDALRTRASLAEWTGETGDPVRARDMYAELLPIHERVYGPEHRRTLKDRDNLAYWTGIAGDPVRARDMYAELLPVVSHVLGLENPETLNIRASLAQSTGGGHPVQAREQLANLLPVSERVLGRDHPHTVAARRSLAQWARQAPGKPQTRHATRNPRVRRKRPRRRQ